MAAGKSSQSNAMLYTVITFVGLFLLSTVLAVVFYVKFEDERTLRVKDKQKALELASVGEYSNIVKTVGQVKGNKHVVVDQIVENTRACHHKYDGHTQAYGCLDFFGDGEKRAHTKKICKEDIVCKYRREKNHEGKAALSFHPNTLHHNMD